VEPSVAASGEAVVPPKYRKVVIGVIGAVVVIALVIVGILVFNMESAALSAGSGTATITWIRAPDNGNSSSNPPQPFTGTIGGHAVSGVATFSGAATITEPIENGSGSEIVSGRSGIATIPYFHYRGTLAGKAFDLGLSFGIPKSGGAGLQLTDFVISGTYDGNKVSATIEPPTKTSSINQSSPPLPFHGTIGKWKVTGTIHLPSGTNKQTATATYTLTSG
jgi:hypothetical protein